MRLGEEDEMNVGRCPQHGRFSWEDSPGGCPRCPGDEEDEDCPAKVLDGDMVIGLLSSLVFYEDGEISRWRGRLEFEPLRNHLEPMLCACGADLERNGLADNAARTLTCAACGKAYRVR